MAALQPLDTTIGVVTPENIAFEYQLAGPFRRLPAYLIDVAVRWGSTLAIGLLILMAGGAMQFISSFVAALSPALILVAVFVINWFYGTICEAYFNGRTIGKWFCGIRVIEIDGRPISPRSALLRNLLRIADMAPVAALSTWNEDIQPLYIIPTGIFGLVSMIMTRRMQRLGDLAAGTMVVVDERKWQLPIAKVDDARVPALASYIPGDYLVTRKMARTLATYVERRHFLTPQRRREVARHLTDPLIERFEFRNDIDPDLLLYSLYYQTFLAESTTADADLGPLSGYSPLAKDANKFPPSSAESLNSISTATAGTGTAGTGTAGTGTAGTATQTPPLANQQDVPRPLDRPYDEPLRSEVESPKVGDTAVADGGTNDASKPESSP